jgi:hypothetical protein
MWLEVPSQWVQQLAGLVTMPANGPLQLTSECGIDAYGNWATVFQAIDFTAYTPTVLPVSPVNC